MPEGFRLIAVDNDPSPQGIPSNGWREATAVASAEVGPFSIPQPTPGPVRHFAPLERGDFNRVLQSLTHSSLITRHCLIQFAMQPGLGLAPVARHRVD